MRESRIAACCLTWRLAASTFNWRGEGAPVQFVIEQADWAIRWVGEHVRDEIEAMAPGSIQTTTVPQRVVDRIVHFGSQYMWLTWGRHMSRSNRYVTSFFHGKPEDGPDVARHIDAFLTSLPRLEKVVTAAGIVEQRLLDWGVPRGKLVRIPIGVDTKAFSPPTSQQRNDARRRHGIPDHVWLVGSFQKDGVGWNDGMEPKLIKGPDIFVASMARLKAKGFPVMAFLTGPARGYVKKGLERHGIPYVHTYASNHLDLVSCYHSLDLYLVTSREEGGPMGLMESMACGIPVVSTPVGMAPDLIRNGETGALVSECSTEAVAESAQLIIEMPSTALKRLSSQAREAVGVADWSVVGRDHWLKVYQPLLLK